MLCVAHPSSDGTAYTLNGNAMYCPDGYSIRVETALSGLTRKQELLNDWVCNFDDVQSQCSEKRKIKIIEALNLAVPDGAISKGAWMIWKRKCTCLLFSTASRMHSDKVENFYQWKGDVRLLVFP
ncbi:hypothetical protein PSENEW3n2_00005147 [Picochlorum sp. SENEW3]|nr:hypothetical protein PSENEW3n2_00005147 [Picochlorum sp. SENEW3]WPT17142.1 hypothetical protein PSENEW3_00005147 [Picochlorum sp. SENEW3]